MPAPSVSADMTFFIHSSGVQRSLTFEVETEKLVLAVVLDAAPLISAREWQRGVEFQI